jgi:hypothetical protein
MVMYAKDKKIAEAVLSHICVGGRISGIRFGPTLQILIDDFDKKAAVRGLAYVNLSSTWAVYDSTPATYPDCEEDLPELSADEQCRLICSVRESQIMEVELGESQPHLIIKLEAGKTIFINGRHEMYECWQSGVSCGDPNEMWMVVACPGGGVAVWAPESFVL